MRGFLYPFKGNTLTSVAPQFRLDLFNRDCYELGSAGYSTTKSRLAQRSGSSNHGLMAQVNQSEDGSGLASLICRRVSPRDREDAPALVQRSSMLPLSSV